MSTPRTFLLELSRHTCNLMVAVLLLLVGTIFQCDGQAMRSLTRALSNPRERKTTNQGSAPEVMSQYFDRGNFDLHGDQATPCDQSAYQATYQTGAPSTTGPEFLPTNHGKSGSYYREERKTRNWFDARADCKSYGADLIVLSDDSFYNHAKKVGIVNNLRLWVGAEDLDQDSIIYWLNGEKARPGSKWTSSTFPRRKGLAERCVESQGRHGLNDHKCHNLHNYICQLSDISTGNARFQVVGLRTRGYMKVGEKLTLRCEAIMLDTAQLQLNIGQEYQWSSDGSVKGNASKVMVYWSRNDRKYAYVGIRCLPWFNITLALSVTHELDGKMISCCSLNGGRSHCVNKTIVAKTEPRKPIVKLGPHGSATMGEDTTYTCLAMPGEGTAVALAVMGPTETWVRVITMNKRPTDTGNKPAWIDRVSYKTGRDTWWGGNHINISVELTITPAVREAPLGCYSSGEVGELVGQYGNNYTRLVEEIDTTLDEDEFTAGPMNIIYNASSLELDSPYTSDDYQSIIVAYGCDLLTFTCKGHVGTSGGNVTLTVKFMSGDNDFYDSYSGEKNSHPSWLTFDLQDVDDFEKGPTYVITANISVDHDITNVTGVDCRIRDRPEPELSQEINTFFRFAYGNTAPILTHSFIYLGGHPIRLDASCTARVGIGDTSTWELVDNVGSSYYTLVSLHGYVTAIFHHPSLRVKFTKGYWDDTCGNIIVSEIVYIIDSRESVGSTLICYSLNVEDSNFTSRLTREELSARVNILGGGLVTETPGERGPQSEIHEALLIFFGPFIFIAAILTLVLICIRKKRTRHVERSVPENLGASKPTADEAMNEMLFEEDPAWEIGSSVDVGSAISGGGKSMPSGSASGKSKGGSRSIASSLARQPPIK